MLNEEHFFSGSNESNHDEQLPLRSKTLANDQHYSKTFQSEIKDSLLPDLKKEEPEKKKTPAKDEDDDEMDEDEEARLLRMIEQESDSDEEESENDASEESSEAKEAIEKQVGKEEGKQGSDNSIISEEDLLNRSL